MLLAMDSWGLVHVVVGDSGRVLCGNQLWSIRGDVPTCLVCIVYLDEVVVAAQVYVATFTAVEALGDDKD